MHTMQSLQKSKFTGRMYVKGRIVKTMPKIEADNKSPEDYIVECMTTEDAEYDYDTMIEALAVVIASAILKQRAARGQMGKTKLN